MDSRDWMSDPTKKIEEYIRGVNEFLEFAFRNVEADGKIFCPCKKCANTHLHSRTSVYLHLTDSHRGFLRGYRQWIFHGERPTIPLNRSFEEPREMEHDMEGHKNEKRGRVHCLGKIPPAKKSKTSSSTDADLREEVMQIKGLLTNVLKLMQSRFPAEDVQNILQLAAEQVPDASSKPNDQSNSGSQSS